MAATARHRDAAPEQVAAAVLTVSDTRTASEDRSGAFLRGALEAAGHRVVGSAIVRDDAEAITARLRGWIADPRVDAVLTTGGTGIARRDGTVEVVRGLLEVELPGFGELFRMLSHAEVGAAAMLSRTTAGAADGTAIFTLPGSLNAVRTAWTQLLEPELAHVVWELRR